MSEKILVSKPISIREAGHNEQWLRDIICNDSSILADAIGIEQLQFVTKERIQSSGGRLDILMTDPEDNSMYEIELMLGDTDETHIIRTIEYWDNEKRKYPQREHTAVIIAEEITGRFFNIVRLLSLSIPIIAIKVNLLQVENNHILNFTKILDIYEEPEIETTENQSDEKHWKQHSDWTLETTKTLLNVLSPVIPKAKLNFVKNYISINDGANIYFLDKRSVDKSRMQFTVKPKSYVDKISKIFDQSNISYDYRPKYKDFNLTIDKALVEKHKDTFIEVTKLFIELRGKKTTDEE